MRGFIVLFCSIGAALGAPQYSYPPAQSSSSLQQSSFFNKQNSIASGSNYFGSSQLGLQVGQTGFGESNLGQQQQQQAIITKQFFIHSAPEEQDEVGADKLINLGPGRKHYRVVFIKAPYQGVQSGKVRFVAPANEEKTVIYVLSKKSDAADIQADVQQAQSEPSKPEVHFIKYKTNEEALHAQRQIQAKYDQLGGTSQVSDEGIAPVQSVIGVLSQSSVSSADSSSITSGSGNEFISSSVSGGGAPSASYLPPNH